MTEKKSVFASNSGGVRTGSERAAKEDAFHFRVGMQQFLNECTPLFEAFARIYPTTSQVINGEDVATLSIASRKLAEAIAVDLVAKGGLKVAPKTFLNLAAMIVARRWTRDMPLADPRLPGILADTFVRLVPMGGWGGRGSYVSLPPQVSVRTTALQSAFRVASSFLFYDLSVGMDGYRQVMGELSDLSKQFEHQTLDSNHYAEDRRSFRQTVVNRFTDLALACHDRDSRSLLTGGNAVSREEILAENLSSFKAWSTFVAATTVVYAQRTGSEPYGDDKSDLDYSSACRSMVVSFAPLFECLACVGDPGAFRIVERIESARRIGEAIGSQLNSGEQDTFRRDGHYWNVASRILSRSENPDVVFPVAEQVPEIVLSIASDMPMHEERVAKFLLPVIAAGNDRMPVPVAPMVRTLVDRALPVLSVLIDDETADFDKSADRWTLERACSASFGLLLARAMEKESWAISLAGRTSFSDQDVQKTIAEVGRWARSAVEVAGTVSNSFSGSPEGPARGI
jgi:hypothetical protein